MVPKVFAIKVSDTTNIFWLDLYELKLVLDQHFWSTFLKQNLNILHTSLFQKYTNKRMFILERIMSTQEQWCKVSTHTDSQTEDLITICFKKLNTRSYRYVVNHFINQPSLRSVISTVRITCNVINVITISARSRNIFFLSFPQVNQLEWICDFWSQLEKFRKKWRCSPITSMISLGKIIRLFKTGWEEQPIECSLAKFHPSSIPNRWAVDNCKSQTVPGTFKSAL